MAARATGGDGDHPDCARRLPWVRLGAGGRGGGPVLALGADELLAGLEHLREAGSDHGAVDVDQLPHVGASKLADPGLQLCWARAVPARSESPRSGAIDRD